MDQGLGCEKMSHWETIHSERVFKLLSISSLRIETERWHWWTEPTSSIRAPVCTTETRTSITLCPERWDTEIISCTLITSYFQLDNIRNHIKLTKEHIDALNATFASYQKPPQIFISEYEEWTEKLHKFTMVRFSKSEDMKLNNIRIFSAWGFT